MPLTEARDALASILEQYDAKVVFAESCTGGLVCATMTQAPGISNYLCGSAVTYRPDTKHRWLGVDENTIQAHTCQSRQVVEEMAVGVLRATPEADWAAAIVGHVENEAAVWISIARRELDAAVKLESTYARPLRETKRVLRQQEAVELLLNYLKVAMTARLAGGDQTGEKSVCQALCAGVYGPTG